MKSKNSNDKKTKNNQNKNIKQIILLNKKLSSSPRIKKLKNNNIFTLHTIKEKIINNKYLFNSNSNKILKSNNLKNSTKSNFSPIKQYLNEKIFPLKKNLNINKKYIEINDIIGEETKKSIDIIFKNNLNKINSSKVSNKSYGKIKAYGANTNKGIIRNYNEDRVSIIINMDQPKNYINKIKYPNISYFGIFDGHGGNKCAEYLRDNLLSLICTNKNFPSNINLSIKEAFKKADKDFLKNYALKDGKVFDYSGSCALLLLIIDNIVYVVNLGDSRCLISCNNGQIKRPVTRDHKPNYSYEKERIMNNGGIIYQNHNIINFENGNFKILNGKILVGPHRVLPGRLSVSRTIGDAEAKLKICGGLPNVIINEPDIYSFNISKDNVDYFILGCDGVFEQLKNEDIFECVSLVINSNKREINNTKKKDNQKKDIHSICGDIVNLILNASMQRKSFDNVTCIFILFKDILDLNNYCSNNINLINKNINILSSSNNIINNNLKNKLKKDFLTIKKKQNSFQNIYNQNKNRLYSPINYSEQKKYTIDYSKHAKKKIIHSYNYNNNFHTSFNNLKNRKNLEQTPNIKQLNDCNSQKRIEIYNKNFNDLNKRNKLKILSNSYSTKYYSFSEQSKNIFVTNKNLIKPIYLNYYNRSNSNYRTRKYLLNLCSKPNSNSKKKIMYTEENKKGNNKDKNFYVNIIFNREINTKNYKIDLKNRIKKKTLKNNISSKRLNNKILNKKLNFDIRESSPKNCCHNVFTYSSYNSKKYHNNILFDSKKKLFTPLHLEKI